MVAVRQKPNTRSRASPRARLPRKAARRIVRDVIFSFILLAGLITFLRIHNSHLQPKVWPEITPPRKIGDLPVIPRNLYYMNAEDVIYCYIPKNACSRFKPLLRKREGFKDWADPRMVHGKRNGLQRLMWLARPLAMRRLRDHSVRKFVVVRDPFSRLISAYQNKIATPWPDQRDDFWNKHLRKECPGIIEATDKPKEGPLMSLEDFLKCLLSNDNTEPSNEHWRPQTQLCGLDYIKYDRYLHLETLASDAAELLEFLRWKENATAFRIQRAPVYTRHLADYFSPESLELALKYYEDDFAILRYPHKPSGTIDFYSVFDGTNFVPGFVPPVDFQPPPAHNNTDTTLG